MAKKHRTPETESAEHTEQFGQLVGGELDNALLLQQLQGGEQAPMALIGELTAPRVERALLALSLQSRPQQQVERFATILERSGLSPEQRSELVLRLRQNEALAGSVSDAVGRFFGEDSQAIRDELARSLDAVWQGLARGESGKDGWRVDGQDIPLSSEAHAGSEGSRSQALMVDLGGALLTEPARQGALGAGHQPGLALAALVRAIQGLVGLDEEEEEEVGSWVGVD